MKQLTITSRITNRESESFNLYLKDIYSIPILTPAEEIELTKKAASGDVKAKNELVERNLRFVVSVAKQYANANNPLPDLVNEGNIGLIMAAEKFDPNMGWKFISYGVWWITKIILEHLAKNGRMVRLPANKINALSKLEKQMQTMEQLEGRTVGVDEIIGEAIEELMMDDSEAEDKAVGKLKSGHNLLNSITCYSMDSLDREIGNGDEGHTTVADLLSDDSTFKQPDHLINAEDTKNEVARIVNTLKPRDKRIMVALYGLDGNQPMTLKEVGDEVGVTREMIRQIKEKTLLTLKKKLVNSSIRSSQ